MSTRPAPVAESRGTAIFDELWRYASVHELDPVTLQRNRVVTDQQPLVVKSAYKMLRTRLLQRMRANRWSKLGITSARAGAGKSLTAINTAISIAREPNQNVILVDLDLRRPSIARYLDIEPQYDLSDYLLNDIEIEDVVVKTSIERLLIIPAITAHENSSELLSSPRMMDLVRLLSADTQGCTVIFDFPPMLDADDLLAFSPNIDALLFIVAECETRRSDLQQAQGMLEDLHVIGVILNKSDDKSPAYY
ncbi:MAG TPA: CpsD/CapB family tyrosine-protein kinase [Woeseiaceae bacterium]|nr:CpsD/CapB family tyrosine-protein kinase [Woeseiaceae bacterium]